MSLNSLKIATEGYLKRATKAALIIAVSGYLNYSDGPTPPSPVTPSSGFSGSNGGWGSTVMLNQKRELFERIEREDDDIMTIIKVFLTWQG